MSGLFRQQIAAVIRPGGGIGTASGCHQHPIALHHCAVAETDALDPFTWDPSLLSLQDQLFHPGIQMYVDAQFLHPLF